MATRIVGESLLDPSKGEVVDNHGPPIDKGIITALGNDSSQAEFAELGMSIEDCLRSATIGGAEILGIRENLGTIEPGKAADIVVVDGNPLEDLAALRRTDYVFLGGRAFRPEDFAGSLSVSDLPSGDF